MTKKLALWFPILLPAYVLRVKLGPFPTTALELAFVALAIFVTLKEGWTPWRDGFAKMKPWHLPAGIWILATLVAIAVAPDHVAALGLWRAYVLEPMLFAMLLAGTMRDEKDRDTVITALVASVAFVAVWSVLQYLGLLPIPHPWDTNFLTRRATGPFPFPNAVSLFCAPVSALCIGLLSHPSILPFVRGGFDQKGLPLTKGELRGSWMRIVTLIGFFSGLLATILAKSVGGFLAILVASLLALIWNKKTRRATLIVSILLATLIVVTPKLRTPIVSYLSFQEWSGQVRLITWRETRNMLNDHPIFGAGLGAYPDAMKPYHTHTAIEIFQYPHTILLNLWSETGLLGILAFGWICVTWIKLTTRKNRTGDPAGRPYIILPLIAILIHGLVDVPYFKNDLAFLFWILAVLA